MITVTSHLGSNTPGNLGFPVCVTETSDQLMLTLENTSGHNAWVRLSMEGSVIATDDPFELKSGSQVLILTVSQHIMYVETILLVCVSVSSSCLSCWTRHFDEEHSIVVMTKNQYEAKKSMAA